MWTDVFSISEFIYNSKYCSFHFDPYFRSLYYCFKKLRRKNCLGSAVIECGEFYSSYSQDFDSKMNKFISTEDRVFMSMVGPAASGKSHSIFQMLKGTFVPAFDKFFYFYQYFQKLYAELQKEIRNIDFIGSLDFDFSDNLQNDGTNYLLIFDDSCDEISRSEQFEKIAIAGRHRKLNCIYIKHNLFHKSANGRDTELQNTHMCCLSHHAMFDKLMY